MGMGLSHFSILLKEVLLNHELGYGDFEGPRAHFSRWKKFPVIFSFPDQRNYRSLKLDEKYDFIIKKTF